MQMHSSTNSHLWSPSGGWHTPSYSSALQDPNCRHPAESIHYNGRPGQQRRILTRNQAIAIYAQRNSARASTVAAALHVNAKTVRDIWNRRTWAEETQHLWEKGEQPVMRSRRRMARFGRSGSAWSAGALSGHETERSCSSGSSSVSRCEGEEERSGLEDRGEWDDVEEWVRSSECQAGDVAEVGEGASCSAMGWQPVWEWECGVAPLSGEGGDPFGDGVLVELSEVT
mmetsp:Transcript_17164/g.47156  ORF Transcript_17164/g.47156 Transcript_17164/m.47156 type:complete len:228 (-) Transcript_17164:230-913(-)